MRRPSRRIDRAVRSRRTGKPKATHVEALSTGLNNNERFAPRQEKVVLETPKWASRNGYIHETHRLPSKPRPPSPLTASAERLNQCIASLRPRTEHYNARRRYVNDNHLVYRFVYYTDFVTIALLVCAARYRRN